MRRLSSYLTFVLTLLILLAPLAVFAFSCLPAVQLPPTTFEDTVCLLIEYANPIFGILVGATLIVFVWGVAKFILAAGDEKKIAEGKTFMLSGVIALFVMLSIWGILNFFLSDIGYSGLVVPQLPEK